MRILHLDSGRTMRGGQWQALRLARGLVDAGHSCSFLAPQSSPVFEAAKSLGLEPVALSALALRSCSRQTDLTHAHDAHSHTLAALLSAAPLVVSRRVAFPVKGGISRWKYARARHYIAVSKHVQCALMAAGIGPERISVVYDGVPLLLPSAASSRIVAPASADPRKGATLSAEAARLASVPLHFSTDLEADLKDAGMFVYITQSEGLGSGVLLAMSAGVPVIASNVGGLPEIVRHEETGLLTGDTAAEIAASIRRLATDKALADRLAARARMMVEESFSVAAMVTATVRVYEGALGGAKC